jgi:hypothetical protein
MIFLSEYARIARLYPTALSCGPFEIEVWGNYQSDAKRAARPSRFGRSSIASHRGFFAGLRGICIAPELPNMKIMSFI